MALLALALSATCARAQPRRASAIALVDVSASIGDKALEEGRAFLAALGDEASRRGAETELRMVRFAATAEEVPLPSPAALRFAGADPGETDSRIGPGTGPRAARAGQGPTAAALSDGRETRGDLLAEAERARRRGARVFFHVASDEAVGDVAIVALEAPEVVRPGASFDLVIKVLATGAGAAGIRRDEGRPPARTRGRTHRRPDPGAQRPAVAHAPRDQRPGALPRRGAPPRRTRAPRTTPASSRCGPSRGRGRCSSNRGARPSRRFVGRWPPSRLRPRRSRRGRSPSRRLGDCDSAVLSDLPSAALRPSELEALVSYVRDDGGGLLVTGGPDGLGSGAFAGTKLEPLLPTRNELSDERQEATLALGLVIDRSGSMSGPKMELTKEAARGTAALLGPRDLITVVVFDSQPQTVVRLQPAANRQRILGDIAQIRASGGTNILPALREALEQLLPARARKKHVIVLSDGQSPAEGIQETIDEAAAAHITVSAVGVGEGADVALLQMIAGRGAGGSIRPAIPAASRTSSRGRRRRSAARPSSRSRRSPGSRDRSRRWPGSPSKGRPRCGATCGPGRSGAPSSC